MYGRNDSDQRGGTRFRGAYYGGDDGAPADAFHVRQTPEASTKIDSHNWHQHGLAPPSYHEESTMLPGQQPQQFRRASEPGVRVPTPARGDQYMYPGGEPLIMNLPPTDPVYGPPPESMYPPPSQGATTHFLPTNIGGSGVFRATPTSSYRRGSLTGYDPASASPPSTASAPMYPTAGSRVQSSHYGSPGSSTGQYWKTSPPPSESPRVGTSQQSHRNVGLRAPPRGPVYATEGGEMQFNSQGRALSHVCAVCMRAFDRPSALQIHQRSHTGERPFACAWPGCQKYFTTNGNMVKHSKICAYRVKESEGS